MLNVQEGVRHETAREAASMPAPAITGTLGRRGPPGRGPPPVSTALGQLHLLAVAQPLDDARVTLDDRRRFAGASGAGPAPPSSGTPPSACPPTPDCPTAPTAPTNSCEAGAAPPAPGPLAVSVLSGSFVESMVDTSEKKTALDSSESAPPPLPPPTGVPPPPVEQSSERRWMSEDAEL
uniref:Uncharacterized protein n=1 Tax=Anopheles merus TaxID=30066 RepID=A0A182VNI0_ANOME